MPTDAFEIADSQDLDYNGGATGARVCVRKFNGAIPNRVVDKVKEVLLAAGWTDAGASAPQASIIFPYGLPSYTPPLVPPLTKPTAIGPRIMSAQGITFKFYDPSRELPGATTATVKWVMMGTSSAQSLTNLITAVETNTGWTLTSRTQYPSGGDWLGDRLEFEYDTPGTQFNAEAHGGEGAMAGVPFWSHGGANSGGGWKLRSTMASGEWLEVWVYVDTHINFSFTTSREGSPRVLTVWEQNADYTLVANQFQFAVFGGGATAIPGFVFASQPYLQHGCDQAAFITGGWGNRSTLSWTGNTYYGRETPLVAAPYTAVGPKAFVLRCPAPLVTSQGYTLVSSAYIGIPNSTTGDAVVVGKLWDAFITTKSYALDEELFHRNKKFICIFRNSGFGTNPASIWVAYE